MKRTTISLALALSMLAILMTCTPTIQHTADASPVKKPIIGFLINGLNHPYPTAVTENAKKEAEANGVDIIVLDAQESTQREADHMLNLISQKVDVICVCPIDTVSILNSMEKAKESGIPVITYINDVEESGADLRITFVGTDFEDQGRMLGTRVVEMFKDKGANVVEIMGTLGSSGAIYYSKGFREAIADYGNIKIIDDKPADWAKDKAMSVMEAMLVNYKEIDIAYAHDFEMAQGAYEAIEATGRQNHIMMVTNGVDKTVEQMIRDGKITCATDEAPDKVGISTIQAAMKIINGQTNKLEPWTKVPIAIIDSSNIAGFNAAF